MGEYNHQKIEKKWQKIWEKKGIYKTGEGKRKPKYYILDMFPYPSGEGLHVGHPRGYIATDVYSRYMRMKGFNILHPMGWDAFGLPAENYAIKHKIHPKIAVAKNIKRFKRQLKAIGFDYDWSREINTTDADYYKWTQWIFLQFFKKGLAFQSFEPINWCPSCKTGLALEDLDGNLCERCGAEVEKKPMRQWVLKITKYADRLLNDLKLLDWPSSIIEQQKNWIGQSNGAEIEFKIQSASRRTIIQKCGLGHESCLEALINSAQNLDEMATYLGYGLANIVDIFNPQMIIIGGGKLVLGDFLPKAVQVMKEKGMKGAVDEVEVVYAKLEDRSGVYGGVKFAYDSSQNQN